MHAMPPYLHALGTLAALAIEIVGPWLLFRNRRWRHTSAMALVGLQAGIALSGNYCFFNLLAAGLCGAFVDDQAFKAWLGLAEPPSLAPTQPVQAAVQPWAGSVRAHMTHQQAGPSINCLIWTY